MNLRHPGIWISWTETLTTWEGVGGKEEEEQWTTEHSFDPLSIRDSFRISWLQILMVVASIPSWDWLRKGRKGDGCWHMLGVEWFQITTSRQERLLASVKPSSERWFGICKIVWAILVFDSAWRESKWMLSGLCRGWRDDANLEQPEIRERKLANCHLISSTEIIPIKRGF